MVTKPTRDTLFTCIDNYIKAKEIAGREKATLAEYHKFEKHLHEYSLFEKYVIPVFDVLNSREAILLYRANYPSFDQFANHIILLEEAMIYGRSGDIEKASELFNKHYQNALVEYKADFENGIQTYLRKGERLVYRNTKTGEIETIIADKDGYVITYSANRGHIDYLETLASELGIVLKQYKSIDDLISDAKAQSKENEAKKNMTESDDGCTPGGRDEPPRYIPDKER